MPSDNEQQDWVASLEKRHGLSLSNKHQVVLQDIIRAVTEGETGPCGDISREDKKLLKSVLRKLEAASAKLTDLKSENAVLWRSLFWRNGIDPDVVNALAKEVKATLKAHGTSGEKRDLALARALRRLERVYLSSGGRSSGVGKNIFDERTSKYIEFCCDVLNRTSVDAEFKVSALARRWERIRKEMNNETIPELYRLYLDDLSE